MTDFIYQGVISAFADMFFFFLIGLVIGGILGAKSEEKKQKKQLG